jgi:hypothetical protein
MIWKGIYVFLYISLPRRTMRSYVFTPLERRILKHWLDGGLTLKDIRLQKVLSRVRLFKVLAGDIDLCLKVRSRLAEPEAARTA